MQNKNKNQNTKKIPVLSSAAEIWRTSKEIESRFRGFEVKCIKRTPGSKWQDRIRNIEVTERTGITDTNAEIKKRRWGYLGHVIRLDIKYNEKTYQKHSTWKRKAWKTKGHMEKVNYYWNNIISVRIIEAKGETCMKRIK